VVSPEFHLYLVPPDAFKVIEVPSQMDTRFPEGKILARGNGFTFTCIGAEIASQDPLEIFTV